MKLSSFNLILSLFRGAAGLGGKRALAALPVFITALFLGPAGARSQTTYEIGRGMFDITGQAGNAAMGGYADGEQKTTGMFHEGKVDGRWETVYHDGRKLVRQFKRGKEVK